jgi:hypothetical protein
LYVTILKSAVPSESLLALPPPSVDRNDLFGEIVSRQNAHVFGMWIAQGVPHCPDAKLLRRMKKERKMQDAGWKLKSHRSRFEHVR